MIVRRLVSVMQRRALGVVQEAIRVCELPAVGIEKPDLVVVVQGDVAAVHVADYDVLTVQPCDGLFDDVGGASGSF